MISVAWTKHLPEGKEKADLEILVRNSRIVLSRLRDIIQEMDQVQDIRALREDEFEDPNWSHKQAFRLGHRAAYRRMNDLLSFLDQRKN